MFGHTLNASSNRHLTKGRGMPLRITTLALCSALLLPGIAMAKKPVKNPGKNPVAVEDPVVVEDPTGCAIFPSDIFPSDIYTNNSFTVKIVRVPAYPGSWFRPTVDVTAVFAKKDGGEITTTVSETIAKYDVTYINTTLFAPSCNGAPCEIDTSVDAVITATVTEPIDSGTSFRDTICTPATATVNPSG